MSKKKSKKFELVGGPLCGKILRDIPEGIEYTVSATITTKDGPKKINHIYQLRVGSCDESEGNTMVLDTTPQNVKYDYIGWDEV